MFRLKAFGGRMSGESAEGWARAEVIPWIALGRAMSADSLLVALSGDWQMVALLGWCRLVALLGD